MIIPYRLDLAPDTPMRCIICGKESTIEDFDRNGAVAVYVTSDGPRPICVCNSEKCFGTIAVLGGNVRRKMTIPALSVTAQDNGTHVTVAVGDMSATFQSGAFINMFMDIGTRVIPNLKPEKGSVRMPAMTPEMRATVLESVKGALGKKSDPGELVCPCCGARDMWTFEDRPGDVTVQCNSCQRSGSGKDRDEALTDLARKKEVTP